MSEHSHSINLMRSVQFVDLFNLEIAGKVAYGMNSWL